MYNLRRIIESMVTISASANENSEPDVMGAALCELDRLVGEALAEVNAEERKQQEAPQEMRDLLCGSGPDRRPLQVGAAKGGPMKPRTYTDEFCATKTWQEYEDAVRPIDWGLVLVYVVAALLSSLFWTWAFPYEDDFTDTGVGCIEECLEPAELEDGTWTA